jgi:hypothetical protein
MKLISENSIVAIFEDEFMGHSVHFYKNKITGEITINADHVIRVCGLGNSLDEFLSTDEGLDTINRYNKEHPGKSFFGDAIKPKFFD